jgi:hypothetical protein
MRGLTVVFIVVALAVVASATPNPDFRTHDVNLVWLTVTNWGMFGDDGDMPGAVGGEFPNGSGVTNIFQGALWIGGYQSGWANPRVSVACDGWEHVSEMWEAGGDTVVPMSNDPLSPFYDPSAIADLEYHTHYQDTLTDPVYVPPDPFDGYHLPLGLEIYQHSYSWVNVDSQDFVLIVYDIHNISGVELTGLYVGLYYDGDVFHASENPSQGAQDDLSGFRSDCFGNGVTAGYVVDNDGNPVGGVFGPTSATSCVGIAFLEMPVPWGIPILNWWVSNTNEDWDWGPVMIGNDTTWDGTPEGDIRKYQVLSNGEQDYDQVYADSVFPGWMDPMAMGVPDPSQIADGYDARFLMSNGPFDLLPGDSTRLVMVVAGGTDFHTDPTVWPPDPTTWDFTNWCNTILVSQGIVDVHEQGGASLPTRLALHPAHPNPFNPTTTLSFDLPNASDVHLEVFDVLGRRVAVLVEGQMPAGSHEVSWDASGVASGVYFARLSADGAAVSRKVVLLK